MASTSSLQLIFSLVLVALLLLSSSTMAEEADSTTRVTSSDHRIIDQQPEPSDRTCLFERQRFCPEAQRPHEIMECLSEHRLATLNKPNGFSFPCVKFIHMQVQCAEYLEHFCPDVFFRPESLDCLLEIGESNISDPRCRSTLTTVFTFDEL